MTNLGAFGLGLMAGWIASLVPVAWLLRRPSSAVEFVLDVGLDDIPDRPVNDMPAHDLEPATGQSSNRSADFAMPGSTRRPEEAEAPHTPRGYR